MKARTFILLLLLGLFFITCKKDTSTNADNTLPGRWKLTETYASTGGGNGTPNYVPVPKTNNDYIIFNTNGMLSGSVYPNEVSYVLKDSVTIAITSKDNSVENYRYSIKNGVLQMSPAGPIFCIEGCGMRFTKTR